MYVVYLRPILTYTRETWSTTQEDEKKLLIFEKTVLRKINGLVRNELTGDYERRKNINSKFLYKNQILNNHLPKAKRLQWTLGNGHVWRVKGSIIRKVLINKSTGKRPRGKPSHLGDDGKICVNADIRMVDETVDIESAIDPEECRGLIEAAKGLNGP